MRKKSKGQSYKTPNSVKLQKKVFSLTKLTVNDTENPYFSNALAFYCKITAKKSLSFIGLTLELQIFPNLLLIFF